MEGFKNRASTDTPDLFDFCAADRLSIGNDRQRLQRRCRQSLWPRRELCPLDRFCVFRTRQNLPSTGNLDELHSVTIRVVVQPQLFERRLQCRIALVGVRSYRTQVGSRHRCRAREKRCFKQLR